MSNDELQKAIDDITNGEAEMNASSSDAPANNDILGTPPAPDISTEMPAGAPAPVSETANPATEATSELDEASLGADPLAGLNPDDITLNTTNTNATAPETVAPVSEVSPVEAPTTTPGAPAIVSEPAVSAPIEDIPMAEPIIGNSGAMPEVKAEMGGIKAEALKELYPLLDKVSSMTDKEKFDVCMEVGTEALPNALQYAKKISDEAEKAEALVKIIEKTK